MDTSITVEGQMRVAMSERGFAKFVVMSHAKAISEDVLRVRCPAEHAGETCPWCLHEFYRCEKVAMLPCGHVLCEACLDNSLRMGAGTCAICRAPVTHKHLRFTILPKY